jgi:hypothetical protein
MFLLEREIFFLNSEMKRVKGRIACFKGMNEEGKITCTKGMKRLKG